MRLALVLALLPLPAHAACPVADGLNCHFPNGKRLEICAGPEAFTYAFGPEAKPELTLSTPFSASTVQPWPGVSRNIWSALTLPNHDITYEVWISAPREALEDVSAGINVIRKDRIIAELRCLPQTIKGEVTFFEDVMTDRGYCWNYADFRWQPAGTCS